MTTNNVLELKPKTDIEYDWYMPTKLLSYNAFFNFVLGGRNIGKTFAFKRRCLKRFIDNGEQFVYLRRTQTELYEMDKENFFNTTLLESLFETFELEDQEISARSTKTCFYGDGVYYRMTITTSKVLLNGEIVCYMKSLSTWNKLKSSEYDNVYTIMFDEVLIDIASSRRYLKNEIEAFMQFVSTVFRHRSGRKIYLLSNATNFNNPWFNYFNFNGDNTKRFWYLKDFNAVIEFAPNKILSEEATPDIFKLSRKSKVFDSNVNNEFQEKVTSNLGKIKGDKIRLYSLYSDGLFMTVYNASGVFYVSKGYDKNLISYTFNIKDIELGLIYVTRSEPISRHIRRNFYNGSIFYEDLETRNKFCNAISGII